MNKNILKTMTLGLACLTLCSTSLAAPRRPDSRAPQKPSQRQDAAPRGEQRNRVSTPRAGQHDRTPAPRTGKRDPMPARRKAPIARHEPAPRPAPAPRRPAPPPPAHHPDEGFRSDTAGWITLGAAILGGIVGGLIGIGS